MHEAFTCHSHGFNVYMKANIPDSCRTISETSARKTFKWCFINNLLLIYCNSSGKYVPQKCYWIFVYAKAINARSVSIFYSDCS